MVNRAEDGEVDYEAFVTRARRRFVATVGGIVAVLIASLYAPWGLVAAGVLTPSAAEMVSFAAGVLLLGAWRALTMKLADPNDAPPGQDRGAHTLRLLLVCGAVLGAVVVLAAVAWLAGWIGGGGVVFSIALVMMLGFGAGSAMLRRAARQVL
jgi:hypothetical protein